MNEAFDMRPLASVMCVASDSSDSNREYSPCVLLRIADERVEVVAIVSGRSMLKIAGLIAAIRRKTFYSSLCANKKPFGFRIRFTTLPVRLATRASLSVRISPVLRRPPICELFAVSTGCCFVSLAVALP